MEYKHPESGKDKLFLEAKDWVTVKVYKKHGKWQIGTLHDIVNEDKEVLKILAFGCQELIHELEQHYKDLTGKGFKKKRFWQK